MTYDYADASLTGLVQEILQAGGSLSFAMQSIVTVLTELAYYQQLQQLNSISNVTTASYVLASAPVRKRGLIAVTVVLGTTPILNKAQLATDSEAEQEVKIRAGKKNKLKNREIVGLFSPDGQSVKVKSAFHDADPEDAPMPVSANSPSAANRGEPDAHLEEQNSLLRDDEQQNNAARRD
ncbi:hypothetical protein PV04_05454 [Phialophora macrospora]|uniref:Uncharacterized protein n=1 Tax=Phialophora macrospora TaxID=1851006 RepID=A0A0D2GBZ8_9EURO|nr:hypothetical protein PV04_05454 [Phialophora macrospora]